MKDFCSKNDKFKSFSSNMDLNLGLQYAKNKLSKKLKKQRWRSKKRSNISVSSTYKTEVVTSQKSKKQKRDDWSSNKSDISRVTCYNCDK